MSRSPSVNQSSPPSLRRELKRVRRLVLHAPPALLVEQPGERVEHGVEVGRDVQAQDLHVVADVHDRRHPLGAGGLRQRVDEARAAEPTAQNRVGTVRGRRYAHAVLAIVPVKDLGGAKTRLAPILSADARARLVLEMLDRVLAACGEADAIARTLLVTPDPSLAPDGVDVLVDAGTRARRRGHPGARGRRELPTGRSWSWRTAPSSPRSRSTRSPPPRDRWRSRPARDGGVNAVALRTVNGFRPLFGVPVETMVEAGRAAGLDPVLVDDPALALDVDRPEDYELLLTSP